LEAVAVGLGVGRADEGEGFGVKDVEGTCVGDDIGVELGVKVCVGLGVGRSLL
jgi:hypothetical protein